VHGADGCGSRWCAIDDGTRFLLGDAFGRLALLLVDRAQRDMLALVPLGEVCMRPAAARAALTVL
jgi:hypothetical protein